MPSGSSSARRSCTYASPTVAPGTWLARAASSASAYAADPAARASCVEQRRDLRAERHGAHRRAVRRSARERQRAHGAVDRDGGMARLREVRIVGRRPEHRRHRDAGRRLDGVGECERAERLRRACTAGRRTGRAAAPSSRAPRHPRRSRSSRSAAAPRAANAGRMSSSHAPALNCARTASACSAPLPDAVRRRGIPADRHLVCERCAGEARAAQRLGAHLGPRVGVARRGGRRRVVRRPGRAHRSARVGEHRGPAHGPPCMRGHDDRDRGPCLLIARSIVSSSTRSRRGDAGRGSLVVRLPAHDGARAVELLGEHQAARSRAAASTGAS